MLSVDRYGHKVNMRSCLQRGNSPIRNRRREAHQTADHRLSPRATRDNSKQSSVALRLASRRHTFPNPQLSDPQPQVPASCVLQGTCTADLHSARSVIQAPLSAPVSQRRPCLGLARQRWMQLVERQEQSTMGRRKSRMPLFDCSASLSSVATRMSVIRHLNQELMRAPEAQKEHW